MINSGTLLGSWSAICILVLFGTFIYAASHSYYTKPMPARQSPPPCLADGKKHKQQLRAAQEELVKSK